MVVFFLWPGQKARHTLSLLMLLGSIVTKDYVDFFDDSTEPQQQQQQRPIPVAEVVVSGLDALLPLISPRSLAVRSFCLGKMTLFASRSPLAPSCHY